MSENENSLVTKIIPFLIIHFGLRGAIIFPNSPAIITEVKIFDIISFVILGIFLGFLVILGYNKKLITLLACSCVLGFSVFNLVVKIIYPYGILLLTNHFYRLILLFSLITITIEILLLFCWNRYNSNIQAVYDSLTSEWIKEYSLKQYFTVLLVILGIIGFLPLLIPLVFALAIFFISFMLISSGTTILSYFFLILLSFGTSYFLITSILKMEIGRKLGVSLTVSNKPILEGIFIIVLLSLTGLSIGTPRSSYNSININYEGSQEIIERYLDLEISEYFGGIEALGNDSCSGFNAFKVSPNYLGSTERSKLHEIIQTSNYKAKTSIDYTAVEYTQLSTQNILTMVGYLSLAIEMYHYGYWNDTLHFFDRNFEEQFPNLSWVGDSFNIVEESVNIDNTVGSDMIFHQIIAFLPSDDSILVILSGNIVACYD